jgi:hypothetical protein
MDAGGSTEMLLTIYQPIGGSSDPITVFLTATESEEKNNKVQER